MKYAIFLTVLATLPLAACGRAENAPADILPGETQPVSLLAPEPAKAVPVAKRAAEGGSDLPATVVSTPPALPAGAGAIPPATDQPLAANKLAEAPTSPVKPPSAATPPDLAVGRQVFSQACAYCHDKGVAGAPKTGDAAAWNPRVAQGMDTLYAVALRGKGAMPAKGGNPALTDAGVKAAVDYLVAQAR